VPSSNPKEFKLMFGALEIIAHGFDNINNVLFLVTTTHIKRIDLNKLRKTPEY
jgi:hypothetical protein